VWHVAHVVSKICAWIIDKVGAGGALVVGVVGLLPHAPEAIASRSAPKVRPDRVVMRFFTNSSDSSVSSEQ
jgi:hypothetical protein